MLFNSLAFIFAFLPVVWLIHRLLMARRWTRAAVGFLVLASLFFYGWWDARYLLLLGGSILFNYGAGRWIQGRLARGSGAEVSFYAAVAANVAVLAYFKYAAFAVETANAVLGADWLVPRIILPLGISFFTFQKIAYLADVYQGKVRDTGFLDYALFVSFFPQLIAGPIVHHGEIIPQFAARWRPAGAEMLARGAAFFSIGLFHKCVLADGVAPLADRVFQAAAEGHALGAPDAWLGAAAYAMQIYYDFAGYSYMAVGLAALFNLKFPANFNSPYQARSLVEFWRRWHMTLSRFLRDYIYIPLGGNRKGTARRHLNLWLVMVIGGVWHGAGWTFVLWGCLHGTGLVLNHLWREWASAPKVPGWAGWVGTMILVLASWVVFRSADLGTAGRMFAGLAAVSTGAAGLAWARPDGGQLALLAGLWLGALFLPNWISIFRREEPVTDSGAFADAGDSAWSRWLDGPVVRGLAIGLMALIAVLCMSRESPFLYFQF